MTAADIDLAAHVSEATTAAIACLVDAEIAREYGQTHVSGQPVKDVVEGALMLLSASLEVDLREAFVAATGSDRRLAPYAQACRSILVRDALAARECQCRQLGGAGLDGAHGHRDTCHGHYEADVPEIDGLRLCGECYIAEANRRGL